MRGEKGTSQAEVALQYNDSYTEDIESFANNINTTVRVDDNFNQEAATVTVAGTTYPATVAYYDGTYAHLNITVNNRDAVVLIKRISHWNT